ncbi:hypothetical protein MMC10_010338 [Thelotrema lepadinum]|nr:hypothetical protein [Thelotrema lepadinum]
MGINLEKTIIGFRAVQAPVSFLFLVCICWIEYAEHLGASHVETTVLRFLAALLTIPYTSYDLYTHLKHIELSYRSPLFKLGRLFAEVVLAALWFLSLIMGAAAANTTLGNKNAAVSTVAVLASVSWLVMIVLFTGSVLCVTIQTFRRWRGEKGGEYYEG